MNDAESLAMRIAGTLKLWMDEARLNPTDLSKRTGIARNTIYAALDGTGNPSADTLDRLAREVGTTGGNIFDGGRPGRGVSKPGADVTVRLAKLEAQAAELLPLEGQIDSVRRATLTLVGALELPLELRRSILRQLEPAQSGHS